MGIPGGFFISDLLLYKHFHHFGHIQLWDSMGCRRLVIDVALIKPIKRLLRENYSAGDQQTKNLKDEKKLRTPRDLLAVSDNSPAIQANRRVIIGAIKLRQELS